MDQPAIGPEITRPSLLHPSIPPPTDQSLVGLRAGPAPVKLSYIFNGDNVMSIPKPGTIRAFHFPSASFKARILGRPRFADGQIDEAGVLVRLVEPVNGCPVVVLDVRALED